MIDIKKIRENPDWVEGKLKTKDPSVDLAPIIVLDRELRGVKTKLETLQAKRNALSKEIGEKKQKGADEKEIANISKEVDGLNKEMFSLEHALDELETTLNEKLSYLPNLPMDEIKISPNASDNVCIKTWKNKREFGFATKNHVELGEKLGLFDFKRGAKIAGTNWPVYRGMGARLEWALIQYMIEIQVKNGFTQIIPPVLVKPEMMYASGQLPKFETQLFKINDPDYHLYLIPTAEVALNGLHYDEIFKEEELPVKYVAYTPCFRREAGAAGSQERGLIRVHQFNKVEMFCFTTPEQSESVFAAMMESAQEILEGLDVHYRNMLLVTGDMSFASAKTVDIEVWLPGQNRYYEVSSVSNCTDYQARRSKIRYRKGTNKPELVHTLNGSGLATSRLMVSILENNQREDGSVAIPKVLQRYLGGITELRS